MTSPTLIAEKVQPVAGPTPERRRPRRGRAAVWVVCGLILVAMLAAAWVLKVRRQAPAQGAAGGATAFVPVSRGLLVRSFRVGGTVAAVHFASIMPPALRTYAGRGRGSSGLSLTIVTIAQSGGRVKKGDVLAEFDRQAQLNDYEELQSDLVGLEDQLARRRADIDVEREQRKTELQRAINEVESARLENQRNEVISKIDAEKNQQALAEAEANLKMLRQTQKLRDDANDASVKLLEIGIERQRVYVERARMNYERMIIHSPIDGMAVAVPFFRSGSMGTVQEGDQVRPGMPFLQVVDSSEMIVRARVNQVDAALLRPNGPVQIRLDAYPDVLLPGRVQNVGTMAQAGGSRGSTGAVKTFSALFAVDGADSRLIPDISASVDVLIEQAPDALLVPRGAVVLQAGSRQAGFVWIKQGDTVQARSVKLGPRNDTHWAVTDGLQEGELVAALPPAATVKPPAQQQTSPGQPNSNPPAVQPAATQGSKGPRSKVQESATFGPLDLGILGPCLSASGLRSPASSLLFMRAHVAN